MTSWAWSVGFCTALLGAAVIDNCFSPPPHADSST